MAYDIRPITPEEFPAFVRADGVAYGMRLGDDYVENSRGMFEFDRSLAAFDGETMVGTAGAFSFELTLPGGAFAPVAAVSWVSVLPTHRRQGVLRSIMARQLADVRERGESLAVLTASESGIYRRFGYGVATSAISVEINRPYAGFADTRKRSGRVRLIEQDEALTRVMPEVYERVRAQRPGTLSRSAAYWNNYRAWQTTGGPAGFSPRFYLAYESGSGQLEGFAHYRVKSEWTDHLANGTALINELMAVTPEAYAALWRYCFDLDLVTTIQATTRPLDEPLRWLLAEPRRLRVTSLHDSLWVRLIDTAAALSARRYALPGSVVFDAHDAFCPETSGRYALEGGPEGATCARTERSPDLALDAATLAAAYLGGVSFASLAAAGLVEERVAGALERADQMFVSIPAAYCSSNF